MTILSLSTSISPAVRPRPEKAGDGADAALPQHDRAGQDPQQQRQGQLADEDRGQDGDQGGQKNEQAGVGHGVHTKQLFPMA